MNQEDLSQIEILSIDINTDLNILKNAMSNPDDNTLVMDDLVDFVERIYKMSDEMRKVFVNSIG